MKVSDLVEQLLKFPGNWDVELDLGTSAAEVEQIYDLPTSKIVVLSAEERGLAYGERI